MLNGKRLLTLALAGAVLAAAADLPDRVVGRVISNKEVTINGRQIPAQSVVSWPVSLLDEISTSAESALIQFRDGSTLALQADSSAKIETAAAGAALPAPVANGAKSPLVVRVVRGTATPTYSAGSTLQVFNAAGKIVGATLPKSAVLPGAISSGSPVTPVRGLLPTPGRPVRGVVSPAPTTGGSALTGVLVQPQAGSTSSGPVVILPNGTRLQLTVNPTTNQYTVTSISVPVDTGSSQGTVYLPVTNTTLLNTTLSVVTSGPVTGTGTNVTVSFTDPTTKKPVDATTAETNLQTATNQAFNNAVNNGTVPSTSKAPTLNTPVTTGTFSPVAP